MLHLGASRYEIGQGWESYKYEARKRGPKHLKRLIYNDTYLVKEYAFTQAWGSFSVLVIRRNDGAPIPLESTFASLMLDLAGEKSLAIQIFDADLPQVPYLYYFWVLALETECPYGQITGEH